MWTKKKLFSRVKIIIKDEFNGNKFFFEFIIRRLETKLFNDYYEEKKEMKDEKRFMRFLQVGCWVHEVLNDFWKKRDKIQ